MHLFGVVAYWVIAAAILGHLVLMVTGAAARERRHRQRQARRGELCRQQAAHWDSLKNTLPGSARDTGDLPSAWDPCIVDDPRTPQQGE